MQIRQRFELRHLLAPQLQQSLKILALPLLDLKLMVEEELSNNPFLEESLLNDSPPSALPPSYQKTLSEYRKRGSGLARDGLNLDYRAEQITKKVSLQDVLLRQLGMFTNTDEEFSIGEEIIGNIDENGYLKVSTAEIAATLNQPIEIIESVLKIIQQFEPAGVAARTVCECLLNQLDFAGETDPLMRKIIEAHLEDIAKKNYSQIARALKEPPEKIEAVIKKVLRLDPKPGRNYSTEETQRVIPDIIIEEKGEDLEININNEDLPMLNISKTYQEMLKKDGIDAQTKEFLADKLRNAQELLRAISKRQSTLRKVVETVVEFQKEAIKTDLSLIKPLTFKQVAGKIEMHESTVCRVVMNKYVKAPFGVVALKDFFTSHLVDKDGQNISSTYVKRLIKESIDQEDKKHPLSDHDISKIISEKNNLDVPRRTVAKYREELKILSTAYRKIR